MSYNNLSAGISILRKYKEDTDLSDISLCANHDIIYVGIHNKNISADAKRMLEGISGWHWSDDAGSWAMFV